MSASLNEKLRCVYGSNYECTIEYSPYFRDMMLSSAVAMFLHTSVVIGAFSQTRPQASRTQPSIAAQDDYVKQPQMQKPLEPEELQVVICLKLLIVSTLHFSFRSWRI